MLLSKIIQFTKDIKSRVSLSCFSRSNCMNVMFLSALLLFFQVSWSQYNFADLDREIESKKKLLGNDAVVLLWKGDSIVYKKEMGGFNQKTVAPIASCSKWLTAALVMQFVDEGKISLDDKVSRWLPEFEKYGKNYITIRYCLSHQTGIEDGGRLIKKLMERKKFNSLEEEVNCFAAREIRANPGTDFWYGNIGLNIAARVLEVVSKKRFDLLIKQKLFVPLAMRKTSFSTLDGSPVNPSGGASSNAEDYSRFLLMLLNKGTLGGKQILSATSVAELLKVQAKTEIMKYAPKAGEGYSYALGSWVIEEKNNVATAAACPGLFGTWPMIDVCRGYAYICFVKNILGEERAFEQKEIKKQIDRVISSSCP